MRLVPAVADDQGDGGIGGRFAEPACGWAVHGTDVQLAVLLDDPDDRAMHRAAGGAGFDPDLLGLGDRREVGLFKRHEETLPEVGRRPSRSEVAVQHQPAVQAAVVVAVRTG